MNPPLSITDYFDATSGQALRDVEYRVKTFRERRVETFQDGKWSTQIVPQEGSSGVGMEEQINSWVDREKMVIVNTSFNFTNWSAPAGADRQRMVVVDCLVTYVHAAQWLRLQVAMMTASMFSALPKEVTNKFAESMAAAVAGPDAPPSAFG